MKRFLINHRLNLILVVPLLAILSTLATQTPNGPSEAPTGYSTPTLTQNPGAQSESNGYPEEAGLNFKEAQEHFEEQDGLEEGLGPLYNAQSCVACHQGPVTGAASQVSELRVGHTVNGRFTNPTVPINDGLDSVTGRSLINDRSTCAEAQQRVGDQENLRSIRMSLGVLGDGYIEAVDDRTIGAIALMQRLLSGGVIAGEPIMVPILEAPGHSRVGRFGWKNQHASLLSFAADAYLNEQGITSRLLPTDTTTVCKTTSDPEDHLGTDGRSDIDHFAIFIRGTKAPPVDEKVAGTTDAQAGARLFEKVGCVMCHVRTLTTAPAGTALNGGTFTVPESLGNKTIHPFSDYLLHDIGTGDGIVQNGPLDTANKFRTTPLWGLRTRDRLMHDGASFTRDDAIQRHRGEARNVLGNYRGLSPSQRSQLLAFLDSL